MREAAATQILGKAHNRLVFRRRIVVLAEYLGAMIPPGSRILDIGCGDGTLDRLLMERSGEIQIEGAEILPRESCAIPCHAFDGMKLPFPDKSFDGCMFVDVLHHASDAAAILREARRVANRFVLIKDHLAENRFAHLRLRFMDWVGNRPHGVSLPYNYFSARQWSEIFQEVGLEPESTEHEVPLYPPPFSGVFGTGLHFISKLTAPRPEL